MMYHLKSTSPEKMQASIMQVQKLYHQQSQRFRFSHTWCRMLFANSEPRPEYSSDDPTVGENQLIVCQIVSPWLCKVRQIRDTKGGLRKRFHDQETADLLLYGRNPSPQALKLWEVRLLSISWTHAQDIVQ